MLEHVDEFEGTLANGFDKRAERLGDRWMVLGKSATIHREACPLADQHIGKETLVDRCLDNPKTLAPLIETYKNVVVGGLGLRTGRSVNLTPL